MSPQILDRISNDEIAQRLRPTLSRLCPVRDFRTWAEEHCPAVYAALTNQGEFLLAVLGEYLRSLVRQNVVHAEIMLSSFTFQYPELDDQIVLYRRFRDRMGERVSVYLETGTKRVFAGAVDWPGWCRHGRTEAEALESLLAYASGYQKILARSRLGFPAPTDLSQLCVVERLKGNATTDFGAPDVPPAVDRERACDAFTLSRLETILKAGWRAFDAAVRSARGKELRKGPRGGGRSLDAIAEHVLGAEAGYLAAAGGEVAGQRIVGGARRCAASGDAPDPARIGGRRDCAHRTARWGPLDGSVPRTPRGVARHLPCLGDRAKIAACVACLLHGSADRAGRYGGAGRGRFPAAGSEMFEMAARHRSVCSPDGFQRGIRPSAGMWEGVALRPPPAWNAVKPFGHRGDAQPTPCSARRGR